MEAEARLKQLDERIQAVEAELASAKRKYSHYDELLQAGNSTPEQMATYKDERGAAERQQALAIEDRKALIAEKGTLVFRKKLQKVDLGFNRGVAAFFAKSSKQPANACAWIA
jgi:hypothetical protein